MTAILGLNFSHADSSAAPVLDGKLVAAVAEERLGRRLKHDPAFPQFTIRAVLAHAGISAWVLDFVAIPHDSSANQCAKAQYALTYPRIGFGAARKHLRRATRELSMLDQVAAACDRGGCGSNMGSSRPPARMSTR